jgi:hypothetical protein
LDEIEAFRARNGMSVTAFGKLALNDEGFLHELKRGRWPRPETLDRVRNFMRKRRETAA